MDDDIDTAVSDEEPSSPAQAAQLGTSRLRFRTPIGTQRVLQIVLGAFWLIDAGLQYQPFMFGNQFVSTYITANASGQPEPISWLITTVGHFVSPNVGVWNALFATVQVLIGVGLLFPRTVRPALATSFVWAFGVWFFGEGLGGVLTGTASALSGAPGSVLMYGVIGLMAWPRRRSTESAHSAQSDGIASLGCLAWHRGCADADARVVWILAAVRRPLPLSGQSGRQLGLELHYGHGERASLRGTPEH